MCNKRICDECLKVIMYNLSQDDLLLLNFLNKNKCFNVHLSMDKTKILPGIKGLTDFKFNAAMSRLEVTNLVGRVTSSRPNKFYIKPEGEALLKLHAKDISSLARSK